MSSANKATVNLSDAPAAGFRVGLISALAAGIGILAGLVSFVLYKLIGFFTNIAFYHTVSTTFRSPENNHLGGWVILVPVVGGLIVGARAEDGGAKKKEHGNAEAVEGVVVL